MKSLFSKQQPDKDWLYNQYIVLKIPVREISKTCNVSNNTIRNWLKKFDIKREIFDIKREIHKNKYNRPKLDFSYEGLDKKSLRNKILNDIVNLNMNDTVNFLRIYLKSNKFYSTRSFIRFLLKEIDLLNRHIDFDKKILDKLRYMKGILLKKGLIIKFNSQVYEINNLKDMS